MTTDTQNNPYTSSYRHCACRKGGADLHSLQKEMAALRLSIVLTAKWSSSASDFPDRRNSLRDDLIDLRRRYSETIDEIAMSFGVPEAMRTKEKVESTVYAHEDLQTNRAKDETGELYF